jgi:hypothetical protein
MGGSQIGPGSCEEEKKIFPCPESNPGLPVRSSSLRGLNCPDIFGSKTNETVFSKVELTLISGKIPKTQSV